MIKQYAIIIDLETLSTRPTAKVFEMSMVILDNKSGNIIAQKQAYFDHSKLTGDVDEGTMKWVNDNIGQAVMNKGKGANNCLELNAMLDQINQFVESNPNEYTLYANGANFDFPILRSLIIDVIKNKESTDPEVSEPKWSFYDELCLRTLLYTRFEKEEYKLLRSEAKLMAEQFLSCKFNADGYSVFTPHNSLHDCLMEAYMLHMCYKTAKGGLLKSSQLKRAAGS